MVKVKVYVYSPDIPACRFSGLYINYPQVLELKLSQSHLPGLGENAAKVSVAVLIFVPPGTHFCWVDRAGVDSKLAQSLLHVTCIAGIKPDPLVSGPTP